jgi:pyruvate dehydrogenase E2 component (dihydrolipoamide acetyltransferase)
MALIEVRVPGIGDFKDVGVIDVLVKAGDSVKADDSLITLESDKATMDVPSPAGGRIRELRVKVGDRVHEGSVILMLEEAAPSPGANGPVAARKPPPAIPAPARASAPARAQDAIPMAAPTGAAAPIPPAPDRSPAAAGEGGAEPRAHASPSVRKLARELGVDLSRVPGSGPRGRILQEDVERFVKQVMTGVAPAGGPGGAALDLLPWPRVDFARFGPVESRPLSRIRKISGANLARNWVMIPHVTQHDEADITELEAFRQELNREQEKDGVKVTLLAFLVKACAAALKRFPELNSSLEGDSLVLKRYVHIGFAADTANGLVVPVLRDADRKGILEVARELSQLAGRAREGKLSPADLQGGSFSISSLGGIGGTSFTPIINAPEVAILGVSRSSTRPVWDGKQFAPRLVLPLSLSYDHRVVDGATAARFTTHLAGLLRDLKRAML